MTLRPLRSGPPGDRRLSLPAAPATTIASEAERRAADRLADPGQQLSGLRPGALGAGRQHPLDLRLVGHQLAVPLARPGEKAVEQLEHRVLELLPRHLATFEVRTNPLGVLGGGDLPVDLEQARARGVLRLARPGGV